MTLECAKTLLGFKQLVAEFPVLGVHLLSFTLGFEELLLQACQTAREMLL